jgi:indole-3-glycerol phosphate synthase
MSVLARIFERKASEVGEAKLRVTPSEVEALAAKADPPRGFLAALQSPNRDLGLIAEVKKASPSQGLIRADFDPVAIGRTYARAGADCLSVLTDSHYFQGSSENLVRARASSGLPVLRKDFIFDRYQVYEARSWGADAILLIVAGLDDHVLHSLNTLSLELGMDVLVEVHDQAEASRAVNLGASLIGVNNRNLANFETSLTVSEQLIPGLTSHALTVSESALESRSDLDRVKRAGAKAVLIGTTFCASPDIEAKVREVMDRK